MLTLTHPADPLAHPAARWLADQIRETHLTPCLGVLVYGLTIIDLNAAAGNPVARSSFVAHHGDGAAAEATAVVAVESFDVVALVEYVDGCAKVTRLFVNP
ncbi:MAG: hypothetical protein RLZZ623_2890 [Actinomycetota bacterium]|jgi:hypothetical protein